MIWHDKIAGDCIANGMAGNNDGKIMDRTCQNITNKSHTCAVSNIVVTSCNDYALCRSVQVMNSQTRNHHQFVYVRYLCYKYDDGANHDNNEHEIDD